MAIDLKSEQADPPRRERKFRVDDRTADETKGGDDLVHTDVRNALHPTGSGS